MKKGLKKQSTMTAPELRQSIQNLPFTLVEIAQEAGLSYPVLKRIMKAQEPSLQQANDLRAAVQRLSRRTIQKLSSQVAA